MTILKTTNLTKQYKETLACKDVNITIEKGDIFGLIGQNGAGKTTFMKMITSLTHPTSGSIELFGETDAGNVTQSRSRIGAMIESPALFSNMTAVQNLEYYRLQRGIPEKARVQEVLQIVNLTDTGKKKFKDFSLGMKQRLALAVSLLGHPDFLIFDEPTNGLDPTGIVEMRDLIHRLSKQGITILISSHILTELAQVANKYAIIHEGRLIKTLTTEALYDECKTAVALRVDDAPKAAVALEKIMGIKDYKQISDTEIRIYEFLDDPSEVNMVLAQEGIRVHGIQEVGDTLENYYTNLIGGTK